jgi:hypothetical protein
MTIDKVNVKAVQALIELDLDELDRGGDHLMFLFNHEETGPLVPLNWLENLGLQDWTEDWSKFMHGQTFLEHGFFIRDVQKFLHTRLH